MRLKSPFKPSLRALMLGVVLPTLLTLSLNAPSAAQAPGAGRTRQLQQPEQVGAWPVRAKRFALIVGVDNYADTQITTLGGAANDARAIAAALIRYAGFPEDQVVLLATDQPAERQPTRGNILRKLSNLRGLVPKDGMMLVAFAGHGIEREGQAYLLPADAQVNGDVRLLEDTAINVARMKERIKETGVGQVVLILDACRNDPAGRADVDNPLTPAYTRGFDFDVRNREVAAFATLYATAVGQRAYEFKEKRQGYFSLALVEALKGGAANEKGEVTLANLVRYLQEQVPKRVRIDLGKEQRPFAIIEGYRAEELVVAVAAQTAPAAQTPPTPQPADASALELSYWETIRNSTDPEDFRAYLRKYPGGTFAELAANRLRSLEAPEVPKRQPPPGAGAKTAEMIVTVRGLSFQLESCRMSRGSVTCQFTITNESSRDQELTLYARSRSSSSTGMTDPDGNTHEPVETRLSGERRFGTWHVVTLVPGVAVKGVMKFENVSAGAERLALLRLLCGGANRFGEPPMFNVDFKDVPLEK